ncbi:MAG: hypothetical protein Q9226_008151 [Calogaya cf. arnoldii]
MSPCPISALERLPYEILLSIQDTLDDVSAVCLKNTNSNLKNKLYRDPGMFSRCTKWLVMCRFEQDMPPPDPFGRYPKDRAACALCKTKRTRAQIEGRRSGRSGVSFPICGPCRLFQFPEKRYCAKHPLFITWVKASSVQPETPRYGRLPKAARAGRPYIDGLISFDGRETNYISEVGKFSPTLAEIIYGQESYQYLTDGFPEYDGNLTDVSPWDWKDKKRAKVYTAIKVMIANIVSPFY